MSEQRPDSEADENTSGGDAKQPQKELNRAASKPNNDVGERGGEHPARPGSVVIDVVLCVLVVGVLGAFLWRLDDNLSSLRDEMRSSMDEIKADIADLKINQQVMAAEFRTHVREMYMLIRSLHPKKTDKDLIDGFRSSVPGGEERLLATIERFLENPFGDRLIAKVQPDGENVEFFQFLVAGATQDGMIPIHLGRRGKLVASGNYKEPLRDYCEMRFDHGAGHETVYRRLTRCDAGPSKVYERGTIIGEAYEAGPKSVLLRLS